MSTHLPHVRIAILVAIVACTALAVTSLRGGASAEVGSEGYSSDDFCDKLARLDFVMTSGFEHQQDIGLPATVFTEIKCLIGGSGGVPSALIPVRLEGNLPWVDVEGDFIFNGDLLAEGSGTVAGQQNVKVVLDVFVTTEYEMTGTYTMGADGELGAAAVYSVNGEFGTATLPTPTPPGHTPDPAPTATPAGEPVLWGDNNCSGGADPIDSLLTLRFDAGLTANTGDCPALGTEVDVVNASLHLWGDFDCSATVDPIDSLKLLRFDAGLSVAQAEDCPNPGGEVTIVG